ncbi:MAG: hypothetical protein K9W44_09500 [Candidatus Lokiarchaeota archaeon]|nr:hypothetical protein [Candidatus Harpocratesius repetitus]
MGRLRNFLRRNKYFLLAHHPKCEQFEDDTIKINNTNLCIGCFTAIPTFFIILIIGLITSYFQNLTTKSLVLIGIILSSGYILGKFNFHKIKWLNIISKGMVGAGGAFLVSILWKLPFSPIGRIIMVFVILQFAFLGHGILRAISIYHTCQKCEFKLNWRECPGMKEITYNLDKGF